jgi:hypothetical protein
MTDDRRTNPDSIVDALPDHRGEPRTGATVIRLRSGRLDLNTCPQVLREQGHLDHPDAAMLCAHGPGILADNLEPVRARDLAAALTAAGEPCFVVAAADVVDLPEAVVIASARLTHAELHLVDRKGAAYSCPWDQARTLIVAHVHQDPPSPGGGDLLRRHRSGSEVVGEFTLHLDDPVYRQATLNAASHGYLDLTFTRPLRRFRVDSQHFDFSLLGNQLQPTAEANLLNLARWFLHGAPHLRTNLDAERLLATCHAHLPQVSKRHFDDLSHWLLNLVRFGKSPLPPHPPGEARPPAPAIAPPAAAPAATRPAPAPAAPRPSAPSPAPGVPPPLGGAPPPPLWEIPPPPATGVPPPLG